jgi:hypothetical protein
MSIKKIDKKIKSIQDWTPISHLGWDYIKVGQYSAIIDRNEFVDVDQVYTNGDKFLRSKFNMKGIGIMGVIASDNPHHYKWGVKMIRKVSKNDIMAEMNLKKKWGDSPSLAFQSGFVEGYKEVVEQSPYTQDDIKRAILMGIESGIDFINTTGKWKTNQINNILDDILNKITFDKGCELWIKRGPGDSLFGFEWTRERNHLVK